jgi:cytosine/adenosine deaminase-related metal-dependent hydrolase
VTVTVHAATVVVPVVTPPIRDGAVAVEGKRIVAVGSRSEIEALYGASSYTHAGVLTPGLVNAHTHLQLTAYADMATLGVSFAEWIGQFFARYRATTTDEWLASAREGVRQVLASGTTAVADVDTYGFAGVAAREAGLAGIRYQEVVGADDIRWPRVRGDIEARLDAPDVGLSPHSLYTLSSETLRTVGELARERGIRLHPHAAETLDECEFVLTGTGPSAAGAERTGLLLDLAGRGCGVSPVRRLDDLGLLGPDVHIAHGIHVDAADRELLRQRGTAVALCPRSNAILHAGEAPVAAYLREGNPIAVGTDSSASNVDLDLFGDVRALRDLAVAQGYDEPDLDARLVAAATVGGATALGMADIGRLVAGARADLAVFDVPTTGDVYGALVDHGHAACTVTVLGGRIVDSKGHS